MSDETIQPAADCPVLAVALWEYAEGSYLKGSPRHFVGLKTTAGVRTVPGHHLEQFDRLAGWYPLPGAAPMGWTREEPVRAAPLPPAAPGEDA